MTEELQANPAFEGAGKEAGLEIWRVEQFNPVRQEAKYNGKFFNGDCYIILNSVGSKSSSTLHYDLHFWLGGESAPDEQGAAAMLTVELDTFVLGGNAVQYREVQHHESKLFLSYFKSGIEYLEGGTESGFKTYDPNDYVKRLFQVKGKKDVRIAQVECKCGSLNQGDVFVLDDGPDIFVWVGPTSEKKEQLAGVEFARLLRDEEKAGRAHIHIVEEDWDSNEEFFKGLGSKDKAIRAGDNTPDDDMVRKLDQQTLLYRVEEPASNGQKAKITEIGERPLQQSMLDSDCCFVLDSGYCGIFVWTGKNCDYEFKKKVWESVNDFLESRGYPDWVTVTRVVDGGETALFKQYFETWHDPWDRDDDDQQQSNVADSDYTGAAGVDFDELHEKPQKVEDWMPDDGSGTLTMYRVQEQDLELGEVPDKAHGVFFGGDCYVFQYDYKDAKDRQQHIIYFWQGSQSSQDMIGASAAHAVGLDNQLNGMAVQVRVVMNKEPAHFMKIFNGRIVIFEGGSVHGFESMYNRKNYNQQVTYMFHIRGLDEEQTKAIQVPDRGASLNANDVFIVDTNRKTYVWMGDYSIDQEKLMAKAMVSHVAPGKGDPVVVEQGNEPVQFWDAIGGEEEYFTGQRKKHKDVRIHPRLFQCSNASGRFQVEEIVAYTQHDLDESDVMILDTYDEIFVWVGTEANEFEKTEAYKTAYNYLETDPTGRTKDNTLIMVVRLGFEPPAFTSCFHPWDYDMWSNGKTFHELIDEVGKENAGISLLESEIEKYTSFYPLEELQQNPPPEGVNVTKKEMYLSDEDFEEVFGMQKEKYLEYPEWKRIEMRKAHNLF